MNKLFKYSMIISVILFLLCIFAYGNNQDNEGVIDASAVIEFEDVVKERPFSLMAGVAFDVAMTFAVVDAMSALHPEPENKLPWKKIGVFGVIGLALLLLTFFTMKYSRKDGSDERYFKYDAKFFEYIN